MVGTGFVTCAKSGERDVVGAGAGAPLTMGFTASLVLLRLSGSASSDRTTAAPFLSAVAMNFPLLKVAVILTSSVELTSFWFDFVGMGAPARVAISPEGHLPYKKELV